MNSIIGTMIAERLRAQQKTLKTIWDTATPTRYFYIDDLLPANDIRMLYENFPMKEQLLQRSTLREKKKVGVQLEAYHPLIGEHLMAFQEPCVIEAIADITGLRDLQADPTLYASGISLMQKDDFLNPHLDNSNDGEGSQYRVLNLLFYVTPDWQQNNGGNLELWDESVKTSKTITAAFNRLIVMATDEKSWHSVSKVRIDRARCCLSNYYFADRSISGHSYSHVTSFKGRPGERIKGLLLTIDTFLRNTIRKFFKKGLIKTHHRRTK